MKPRLRLVLSLILCLISSAGMAKTSIQEGIARFVERETRDAPGKVSLRINPLAPGTAVGECANPEVFLPAGSRLWGAINIGVRCGEPSAWTIYLGIEVRIEGPYLVAQRRIAAGRPISAPDIAEKQGDLTSLPDTVLTNPSQAVGQRARLSIASGVALRREHLLREPVVRQGQSVRLLLRGNNFSINSEGKALANAYEGDSVRVRSSSGQTLSGIARTGGVVEVAH